MSKRGEQEVEEALEEAEGAGILREGAAAIAINSIMRSRATPCTLNSPRGAGGGCIALQRTPSREHLRHERRAAELAYHLLAADEGGRALPYALLAGDQAEAVYAHAEAEGHYRAALEVARGTGRSGVRGATLEKLGRSVRLLSRNDEAVGLLERALRGYEALQDQDGELRALSELLEVQGEFGRDMVDEASAHAHDDPGAH